MSFFSILWSLKEIIFLFLVFYLTFYFIKKGGVKIKKEVKEESKERRVIFSGIFKSKKFENFGNWIWFFGKIALIWIVAAWFFDWSMNPKTAMREWRKSIEQERISSSSFNSGRCITFSPGETRKVIKLKPGEWSEWVKVPPGAEYRISSSCNVKINFWDGEIINDSPENFIWTKPRRAIFRILSEKDGESIIVVS